MREGFPVAIVPAVKRIGSVHRALLTGAILVAALYFGRDVFVPLALAVLLSFVLAPLANRLQKLRLGRVPSVLIVVVFAFAGLFCLFGYLGTQVAQLAGELPSYQTTIQEKIRGLRGAGAGGTLETAGKAIKKIDEGLNSKDETTTASPPLGPAVASDDKPIPVEVHEPPPTTLETLSGIATPLLHPLATIGIVVVFVIFILLQREDLRDRLIRLAGAHDLQRTTAAIDDAAKSLSKYFLTQVAVNTGFGVVVAIGLTFIGVPNPILWGALAAVLQFVPYVGSLIAAALPILVAAATAPGWSLALWTAALILGLEVLVGQVVEPMVYGRTSGLSPLAVVISATLWTALWGPVGLLLSTPLTICLVVLGRHVESLEFLDVMLGDKPPLTPAQNFYQRLLARDPEEAAEQAEIFMKEERTLGAYYDEVALKGLELAQSDYSRGMLDGDKLIEMKASVEALVDDLSDQEETADEGEPSETVVSISANQPHLVAGSALEPVRHDKRLVLCIGGRTALDDAASLLLAQLLQRQGFETRVAEFDTLSTIAAISLVDPTGVTLICLSYLDASSPAHLRFAVRRLRRRLPQVKVIVGLWGQDSTNAQELTKSAKGDFTATSLQQATEICVASSQ